MIASFLTTVAVFGPLAFLAGDMGKVLRVIPIVLILVLAVSLVEAFCILPHHLGHALAHPQSERSKRWRARFNDAVDRLRDRLAGRAVDALVRRRYLFLGSVLALLLVCVGLLAGGTLKFRAFPEIEGDVIEARLLLPQGTPLERTEAVTGHSVPGGCHVENWCRSRHDWRLGLVTKSPIPGIEARCERMGADGTETGEEPDCGTRGRGVRTPLRRLARGACFG